MHIKHKDVAYAGNFKVVQMLGLQLSAAILACIIWAAALLQFKWVVEPQLTNPDS